jgi:tripartite-type tricarboxylate transporter receptor subunit TctC
MKRRIALVSLFSAFALAASSFVLAQESWPAKPVTIVIPFPAGGGADIIARVLSARLAERLGKPVVIENKPGAGGLMGTQQVANAPADGYTYVMGITNTFAINRTFYKQLPYDHLKDFQPVTLLAVSPHILVISMETPARDLPEFVAWARTQKGKLSFASYGNGSSSHLINEMFKESAGIDAVHVPYKGMPPALTDVMGNRVTMLVSSTPPAVPLIQSKKLRAIAIFGDRRLDSIPDVPTMEELGYKDSALMLWYGLFAPAATPRAIVDRMSAELKAILSEKPVIESLTKSGVQPSWMPVDEFSAWVRAETERWGKLVVLSGAKAE